MNDLIAIIKLIEMGIIHKTGIHILFSRFFSDAYSYWRIAEPRG